MFEARKISVVSVFEFLKKYSHIVSRVLAAVLLCVAMVLFIVAFKGDKLPDSDKGDAFDTVYAFGESSSVSA